MCVPKVIKVTRFDRNDFDNANYMVVADYKIHFSFGVCEEKDDILNRA